MINMNDPAHWAVWAQLIIAVAGLLTAAAGWIKSQANSKKLDQNTSLTKEIHVATNGKMDSLVTAVQTAASAATIAAAAIQTNTATGQAAAQALVDSKLPAGPAKEAI